jgi:hypothetical protein
MQFTDLESYLEFEVELSELESYIKKEFPKPYQEEDWKKESPRLKPERVYHFDSAAPDIQPYQRRAPEQHYTMLEHSNDDYQF